MAEHATCPTCSCKTPPPEPEGDVLVTDVNGDIWTPEYRGATSTYWSCCTDQSRCDETWYELWGWNDDAGHQLVVYRNDKENHDD